MNKKEHKSSIAENNNDQWFDFGNNGDQWSMGIVVIRGSLFHLMVISGLSVVGQRTVYNGAQWLVQGNTGDQSLVVEYNDDQ